MITNHSIVKIAYELYIQGETEHTEELIERATAETPLTYCQGIGMMLPDFEAALAGKEQGDCFDFVIPAAQAYGEHDEQGVMTLAREIFCIDGVFDDKRVKEGNIIPMNTTDGQVIRAQVIEVTPDNVTIDLNHPLAGEDLHFVGKVIDTHAATDDELDSFLHPKCGGCGGCNSGDSTCGGNCNGCD